MPSRPSRPQRLRVWRGELKKTSGGLTRDDLVKNSKGKIVSRRKSKQAGEQNNLGVWLRTKGDKFGDKPSKQAVLKDKPVAPKPKPKPVVKPKPKPVAPKPKPKPKPIVRVLKDKPRPPEPKAYGVKKDRFKLTVQNILDKPVPRESRAERRERERLEYREKHREKNKKQKEERLRKYRLAKAKRLARR